MPQDRPENSRLTRAVAVCLDLLFPWAGTAIFGRPPAGRWGMIGWMGFVVGLILWVLTAGIDLPQAVIILVVAWVVAQIWIQTRRAESRPAAHPTETDRGAGLNRGLSIALVIAVYVITPTVFAVRLSGSLDTVRVGDLGTFPTVLQDETILVLKSRAGIEPGRLVVWDAPGGPALGRVVAVGDAHVEVSEGLVTIDEQPSTVSRREQIEFNHVRLNARESLEAAGLQYFLERHQGSKWESPAYLRPGVYTVSSGVDVPDGSVFILADNRTSAEAIDSRHSGPVALKNVTGVPLFVIWSAGGGFLQRIDRIGAWAR